MPGVGCIYCNITNISIELWCILILVIVTSEIRALNLMGVGVVFWGFGLLDTKSRYRLPLIEERHYGLHGLRF